MSKQEKTLTTFEDYFSLLKPRVMSLVIFTGLVGLALAPGHLHPVLTLTTLLCISVGSGASGAINMWYERHLDAKMDRTSKRPLPMGKIHPEDCLFLGIFLSMMSVMVMALAVNFLAAGLLALAIFIYVFVYTIWLKPRTPQNIVIGGASGALPPMIGYAGVTGEVTIQSFLMFLIIFMWTPPHFWALSIFKAEDYKKAGLPMLPVVKGIDSTCRHIFVYSILLALTTAPLIFLGFGSGIYALTVVLLNAKLIIMAYKLMKIKKSEKEALAKRFFGFSIFYLFTLFLMLLVEQKLIGLF